MITDTRRRIQEEIDKSLTQLDQLVKITKLPIITDKNGSPLWVDVRELDLRYQIPVKKIYKFYEGLGKGKVMATKCPKCGAIYFPPQADCSKCRSSDLEWIEMPAEGEVVAFTKIFVKPVSFSHYPDYYVVVARMSNGVNVTAWYRGKDQPKVGERVKLNVVERDPEGYLTYEFEPWG
ncbi:3-hydroxybutyryl-CoA epimerase [Sulfolobales archaeon HS-7]|nr:3-hydroxybutyryl-CoA epimerase [Sulfolobales archaeon HS-7]